MLKFLLSLLESLFINPYVAIGGMIGTNRIFLIVEDMIMKGGWKESVSCVVKGRRETYNVQINQNKKS